MDLENELASLRLDDEPPRSRRGPWTFIALLLLLIAAGTTFWWGRDVLAVTEVQTTTPRVERSGGASPGTPLTASGYVVARRKAVVSAKIQGRLADLRVEEGARVREGEVIARLESQDYDAQVRRHEHDVRTRRGTHP